MDSNDSLKETFIKCLTQQISEYELLKSMYSDQGEIILTDKNVVNNINNFLEGDTEYIPNHLDFKLNLCINGYKLELFINLPSSYPDEEPDIYVRCNQLNRRYESKINSELSAYLKENHVGEVCLYTAISWLQENIENFTTVQEPVPTDVCDELGDKDTFVRHWIYSHHIYNKKKRDEIMKLAKEFKLTGFCLPGKPGIICIEGCSRDCSEWWKTIKAMSWKKIVIKQSETFDEEAYRIFSSFEELLLKNPTNSKHANMSELSKYMSERGLSQVFNDLFNLCNNDD